MAKTDYENTAIDTKPFADLVGEDVIEFVFEHAPKKVTTRIVSALDHYARSALLAGIDDAMGAIRLIAAEEELVVAIFEWFKLNERQFPEHKDFVRKFKNHVVRLSFYLVLLQFRIVCGDMIRDGITLDGWAAGLINWTAKPIVDGQSIKLVLFDDKGKELIRTNPLATALSQGDLSGEEVVPLLLADFVELIKDQRDATVKEFLFERADFRNKLLYASDAGTWEMEDSLDDLIGTFNQTYHDLLWVLAILIGCEPPSNEWGLVSQFIALYREVLILAGVLRSDNTIAAAD